MARHAPNWSQATSRDALARRSPDARGHADSQRRRSQAGQEDHAYLYDVMFEGELVIVDARDPDYGPCPRSYSPGASRATSN